MPNLERPSWEDNDAEERRANALVNSPWPTERIIKVFYEGKALDEWCSTLMDIRSL